MGTGPATGFTLKRGTLELKNTTGSTSKSGEKITIQCVKGKVTKKVTGTAPKCPAGYKKKI